MINSIAFDIEVFPNMFSITCADIKSYMEIFKDCGTSALTDLLTVSEIKDRLSKVNVKQFWITDTDDSQLLQMVGFINRMRETERIMLDKEGQPYQISLRTDMYGFNNMSYDDLMIKAFMSKVSVINPTKKLILFLYEFSKKIIKLQDDRNMFYQDEEVKFIRKYKLPYTSVDVMRIFGLHSANCIVDKSGQRIKFGKGLKAVSINLKWHELLDFTMPPIDDEEVNLYWSKLDEYAGFSKEYLNDVIHNDFDRYVKPEYLKSMLYYNLNDVFLVCEICRQKPDEIKLRYKITEAFEENVLCSARANIADKLTVKLYSRFSGKPKEDFIDLRTERHRLSFNKIIFPHIKFKTKQLQDLLEEMKTVSIWHTTSESFKKEFEFYGTKYTVATGGIHSQDPPRKLVSNDEFVYLHHDYTSYYPSIMISYNIIPKHLDTAFTELLSYLKETRVKCKHTKDEDRQIIPGVPNKTGAEAFKIVINAIYGKLGSELFFLYDRFAQMQVTINGQLMTLTLIEELELNGIHVISANTDGIVIKLPREKFNLYKQITDNWNHVNKMGADYETYKMIVSRDVNNYFDIQEDGTLEFKGDLNPKQYIKDLTKGYDMPIVALAVVNFFKDNIPVMDTLRNHKNILDFCKTQGVNKKFDVFADKVKGVNITTTKTQHHVRFYVCPRNCGVKLKKVEISTGKETKIADNAIILNSLDDKPIEERNIDYNYYYNEAYKIINPILLNIPSSQKTRLKKYAGCYNTLFDNL